MKVKIRLIEIKCISRRDANDLTKIKPLFPSLADPGTYTPVRPINQMYII